MATHLPSFKSWLTPHQPATTWYRILPLHYTHSHFGQRHTSSAMTVDHRDQSSITCYQPTSTQPAARGSSPKLLQSRQSRSLSKPSVRRQRASFEPPPPPSPPSRVFERLRAQRTSSYVTQRAGESSVIGRLQTSYATGRPQMLMDAIGRLCAPRKDLVRQ